MTQDIKQLDTTNWQHKIGSVGEIVIDTDDIEQCYETILNVSPGSIPFIPLLGASLLNLIDQPSDRAVSKIKHNIKNALNIQEPRATVTNIDISSKTPGIIEFFIEYQDKLTNTQRRKTVTIGA